MGIEAIETLLARQAEAIKLIEETMQDCGVKPIHLLRLRAIINPPAKETPIAPQE